MGAKVTITTNRAQIAARIKAGVEKMIPAVTEQVLADCQEFVPQDQNVLRATAAINTSYASKFQPDKDLPPEKQAILASAEGSDIEHGRIVWDTPYARKVYMTGSPSRDKNKNASILWCEKAKDTYGKDWQKIAQKAFDEGMGKK